jgi:NADH-quinone oxidoreductase subunit N
MTDDIPVILPEIILRCFAIPALMAVPTAGRTNCAPHGQTHGAGLIVALDGGEQRWPDKHCLQRHAFINDGFLLGPFCQSSDFDVRAASVLIMSKVYEDTWAAAVRVIPVLVALSVVGMMMMVSAGDLIAVYGIISVAGALCCSLRCAVTVSTNRSRFEILQLGALSSGLLLYGASLIYGYAA